jgi:hypothetical protein
MDAHGLRNGSVSRARPRSVVLSNGLRLQGCNKDEEVSSYAETCP